jgi:hypothetical protein
MARPICWKSQDQGPLLGLSYYHVPHPLRVPAWRQLDGESATPHLCISSSFTPRISVQQSPWRTISHYSRSTERTSPWTITMKKASRTWPKIIQVRPPTTKAHRVPLPSRVKPPHFTTTRRRRAIPQHLLPTASFRRS